MGSSRACCTSERFVTARVENASIERSLRLLKYNQINPACHKRRRWMVRTGQRGNSLDGPTNSRMESLAFAVSGLPHSPPHFSPARFRGLSTLSRDAAPLPLSLPSPLHKLNQAVYYCKKKRQYEYELTHNAETPTILVHRLLTHAGYSSSGAVELLRLRFSYASRSATALL